MSYSILQFVNFIIALVRHIMCDFFKTQNFYHGKCKRECPAEVFHTMSHLPR